jgi:hypothetical protein
MKLRVFLAIAFAALAAPAAALSHNYWGFNYLSSTNPPAGTCDGHFPAGYACEDTSGWTQSQVQNNSGGEIGVGFLDTFGTYTYVPHSGIGTYNEYTSSGHWGTAPFRAACSHGGGTNYVQCRGF